MLGFRRAPAERIEGALGRVTGRIGPGLVGEVVISTSRGAQAFYAHAALDSDCFELGQRVRVLEHLPPRTVLVVAG